MARGYTIRQEENETFSIYKGKEMWTNLLCSQEEAEYIKASHELDDLLDLVAAARGKRNELQAKFSSSEFRKIQAGVTK